MRTTSAFVISLALLSPLVVGATKSIALAALCDGMEPPAVCSSGQNLGGYSSGFAMGESITLQIWRSPAVGGNLDNWNILKEQITVTIPQLVSNVMQTGSSEYTTCRVQGLLEGSVCRMDAIASAATSAATGFAKVSRNSSVDATGIVGCVLDGADWGKISSGIYCSLSIALGGLADVQPWFIRYPLGLCGSGFQFLCDETYRYGATYGEDPLPPAVRWFLQSQGLLPESFLQTPECVEYTKAPYRQVFLDSVYVDCSYIIPPQ